MKDIVEDFQFVKEEAACDDVSASILILAGVLNNSLSGNLSHEMCMAIRKGLFGAEASATVSILDRDST